MTQAGLAPVLDYIAENLAGDLSVAALAELRGVSPFHFHRLFRAALGESPKQYVRRLRLERAALQLMHARTSVTEVAFAAGYATHESFTRAFKARFGVPPLRFRGSDTPAARPSPGELRIARLPARRVAFVAAVGPYDGIGRGFERLSRWAARRTVRAGEFLGVYWDDQRVTAPQRTRYQVAMTVDADVTSDGAVAVRSIAAGDYATFSHSGSPDERRVIYDRAYRSWLPALGRRPSGAPPIELYRGPARAEVHIALAGCSAAH